MHFGGEGISSSAAPLRKVVPDPNVERAEVEGGELEALRSTNAQLLRELAALKEREAQAQRLADRDGLTGLYNRRRMLELLESAISEAAQQWQRVGLLFMDMIGFKAVNDGYGHSAVDKMLNSVATRIAS